MNVFMDPMKKKKIMSEDLIMAIFGNVRVLLNINKQLLEALYVAVPAARQTTFAGYCPWNYARLLVRKGQPLQLSFEKPVKAGSDGGFTEPSIEALDAGLVRNEKLMGSLYGKIGDFTYGRSDEYGIDALCADLKAVLAALPER